MAWEIEFTDEFGAWWEELTSDAQEDVTFSVNLLRACGPALARPHADTVRGSVYPNMRELRVQHQGQPYRVLYAFDPRRMGILLLGGDKTGKPRWYQEFVPRADALYREHLKEIGEE